MTLSQNSEYHLIPANKSVLKEIRISQIFAFVRFGTKFRQSISTKKKKRIGNTKLILTLNMPLESSTTSYATCFM